MLYSIFKYNYIFNVECNISYYTAIYGNAIKYDIIYNIFTSHANIDGN